MPNATFSEHVWAARTHALQFFNAHDSAAAFYLDVLLIIFCVALAVLAIGSAVASLYKVTLRVMLAVVFASVALVSIVFVKFALQNMSPAPDHVKDLLSSR